MREEDGVAVGRAGVAACWVGWEAGMRVSAYEGWRSELWGTWWCPGWQPRWHYLRVCYGRKAEENKREKESKCDRTRGREKDAEGEREIMRASAEKREMEKEINKKERRQKERESEEEERAPVRPRGPLQKDTGGQRGIRPTGRATRDRTNKGNV